MSTLRESLADALHEAIDGDFLVGASMSKPGEDVALTKARVSEVVWWAVDAVEPVVATVDQRARTEALSSAADAWQQGAWSDVLDLRSLGTKAMGTAQRVTDWLRARSKAPVSHWLCSCGDWHPDSRDPDDDHRQVMAVGSEGWDL